VPLDNNAAERALRGIAVGRKNYLHFGSLAGGDTASAIDLWTEGIRRVSIERVLFGLAGSLWPLRADLVATSHATGADAMALGGAERFDRRTGVMDQVVWEPVMLARASAARRAGFSGTAVQVYNDLLRIWEHGSRHPLSDSVRALRTEMTNP